jgi:hypothetical protein
MKSVVLSNSSICSGWLNDPGRIAENSCDALPCVTLLEGFNAAEQNGAFLVRELAHPIEKTKIMMMMAMPINADSAFNQVP